MKINDWYDLLVIIYVLGSILYLLTFRINRTAAANAVMSLFIFAILIFTMSRPVEVGTDTQMYSNVFSVYATGIPYDEILVQQQVNYFFYLIGRLSASIDNNFNIFLLFVSGIFLYTTYRAFKLIFESNWHLPFFIFSSTFIYYSFLFNLIRNSIIVGGAFLALYLIFYNPTKRRRLFGGLTLILLFFIHSSAGFLAVGIVGASFLKSERTALICWFLTLGLSITGIDLFKTIQALVLQLFPASTLAYKTGVYRYVSKESGFRIDFVLFTLFFGLIGYFISINWKNPFYLAIVKWYLIQGSIFMLFFSFPYVDRIAAMAWIGLPLLVGYPTIYWKVLHPYKMQIAFLTFLFGLLNLIFVARYDFHLDLF
jgi:hypothetical protein